MRRGTAQFEELRAAGAPVSVRVDIVVNGLQVASTHSDDPRRRFQIAPIGIDLSASGIPAEFPTLDQNAAAKVSTSIQTLQILADDLPWFVPGDMWHPLAPVNVAELHIQFGYQHGDFQEFLPAAVVQVDEIRAEVNGDGLTLEVDVFDRAQALEDAKIWHPYSIPAGSNVPDLIQEQIQQVYPNLLLQSSTIDTRTEALEIEQNKSRGDVIRQLAQSVGHVFVFDADGTPRLQPPPTADADPVLSFSVADGSILSCCRTLSRRGVYNGAIFQGETTLGGDEEGETPIPLYAEAWSDHIPGHPLAYTQSLAAARAPGAFPLVQTLQTLSSQNDLQNATRRAADLLALQPERVSIVVPPEPGLELFDPIFIESPDNKVEGLFTVGALSRPLGVGFTHVGCNERRVT